MSKIKNLLNYDLHGDVDSWQGPLKKSNILIMEKHSINPDIIDFELAFLGEFKKRSISVNTIKNYQTDLSCFNKFLESIASTSALSKLDPEVISDYGKYLHQKYSAHNSLRRRIQTLRKFFDYLLAKNIVKTNPVLHLDVHPKVLDIPRPVSFIDLRNLWVQLLVDDNEKKQNSISELITKRNQLLILLIYGGALKVSDISKLERDDLLLDPTPRVRLCHNHRDPYTIPLPTLVWTVAKEYFNLLDKQTRASRSPSRKLFFYANSHAIINNSLSPRGMELIFQNWREKFDITITPKNLRQAAIFKWLHQGHPDNQIKEWLGVAPSYSLNPYRDIMTEHPYNDTFLEELYFHYL